MNGKQQNVSGVSPYWRCGVSRQADGGGWYGTPQDLAERIALLFQRAQEGAVEGNFSQDDFGIALEVGGRQPHAIDKWRYEQVTDPRKVCKLIINESVPYGKMEMM